MPKKVEIKKQIKKVESIKKGPMVKLLCIEEHRVVDPKTSKTELYEDEFGYVYEVSEDKARVLLATGKFRLVP